MDFNGHEKIVVSGGRSEEETLYNFIETAILQIKDWNSDDITWMIAMENYNMADAVSITKTAVNLNVNCQFIFNKQQIFDYINKDGREDDLIEEMAFFAHGTIFDEKYPNPGYEGQYSIALGYNKPSQNNNLNIFTSDLSKINSSSFAKSSYTYFGSCRTGNKFNGNESFAQSWANLTGGRVKAATGSSYEQGRTYYGDIYEENIFYKVAGRFGFDTPRSKSRKKYGFSPNGCYYYPTITDGGSFKVFEPNDEE